MANESSRQRGFSLLEMLVAFALLAMIGTALYRVFSGALQNAAAAEDYTRAVLIAESRIAALGSGKVVELGTDAGEVEGEKFRWTADVHAFVPAEAPAPADSSAAPPASTGARLVEAVVTVSWPGPREVPRQVVLTTLRLAPGE